MHVSIIVISAKNSPGPARFPAIKTVRRESGDGGRSIAFDYQIESSEVSLL